uniref:Uncharacterized protein n=1 Tax=Plectus sambesii TaxID=2011161 RepID=A0A914UYQ1_9BILA
MGQRTVRKENFRRAAIARCFSGTERHLAKAFGEYAYITGEYAYTTDQYTSLHASHCIPISQNRLFQCPNSSQPPTKSSGGGGVTDMRQSRLNTAGAPQTRRSGRTARRTSVRGSITYLAAINALLPAGVQAATWSFKVDWLDNASMEGHFETQPQLDCRKLEKLMPLIDKVTAPVTKALA